MAISFQQVGSFNGVKGKNKILNNPTSLQFGPDGRLYVAEQNGDINAFTVKLEGEKYVATAHEVLKLQNGAGVVKSIQNHNDDGSNNNSVTNRQVTGLVVTGTAKKPVLYISSSDPRIAKNADSNLDTNSGVVTRVTKTGNKWDAVDIIRGLPRSEENHSVNGMVLSANGNKLYLAVGGNTNNGAPSQFFAYTGEYALSGTVLEIDLKDIESRPIKTDPAGGQKGVSRKYVYDLPTLDDPSVKNNGVKENKKGLDVAGPWGGNDGFNMAILPSDAPLRIFADGFRNHYDLALRDGKLFTVDNGSNQNLGDNPLDANGKPTNKSGAGEATNKPNNGGSGDPEPLFLIEDGGYYGHPAPARSNQDLAWTVYNDNGKPDKSLSINKVSDLSNSVPNSVNIADGFLIDPSKFTGKKNRLKQSGVRIPYDSSKSNSLVNLGTSSNGLVEYTDDAFDGALKGALLVTQFNGNVTLLNLNDAGTGLKPLTDPGKDGKLGTKDDKVADKDGVFPLISGQSQPLDVTTGPDGSIWVAEFGPDNIKVFAPSDQGGGSSSNGDLDGDGILNTKDPFIFDANNGNSVVIQPNQTFLWDFDANQDNNRPGPNGYGGGLTGVMINGKTDFEKFFKEPSSLPGQIVKLDNVKFTTAAGGGTTVIESVANGNPLKGSNGGKYLFHTGVTISPTVDTFTIKWGIFNPASNFKGKTQQIGGYIGTGDQSNYLKLVAIKDPKGEIQVLLEDDDVVKTSSFLQANDLFNVPQGKKIFFELEVDPSAEIATPLVSYETKSGSIKSVKGKSINLKGTAVLDAIKGDYVVNGKTTGLAVGMLSSNSGQPKSKTFQAVLDDIEISATGSVSPDGSGEALLVITDNNKIQSSNFAKNSFQIINTGSKKIKQVEIDVTDALYPDTVFDPFGIAGDAVSKKLIVDTNGGTGVIKPTNASYIGAGGKQGYEGLKLNFKNSVNGGFQPGETIGFSIDMDPNSIAGAEKQVLDSGSKPKWDVGGVSGAELIGSTFTVTFDDGSKATGQLQSTGNQAGSQALASQNSQNSAVALQVNGLSEGGVGTYGKNGPSVIINGPKGETARVVLTKGFIQPETNEFFNGNSSEKKYAPVLQAQLDALAASDFPANNAVEFQTVDIKLTGGNQDISNKFNFNGVKAFNFKGEDQLPLGFVASVVDPANDSLPLGPVTEPIYLQFSNQGNASLSLALDPTSISENGGVSTATVTRNVSNTQKKLKVTLSSSDTSEVKLPKSITIPAGKQSAKFKISGVDDTIADGLQTPTITVSAKGFASDTAVLNVTDDDVIGTPTLEVGLYNADNDTLIAPITDGATIAVGSQNLAIAAIVPKGSPFFGKVESVVLDFNDGLVTQTENVSPYALFGDSAGNLNSGAIPLGSNTIELDLYTKNLAQGKLLDTVTADFTLVSSL